MSGRKDKLNHNGCSDRCSSRFQQQALGVAYSPLHFVLLAAMGIVDRTVAPPLREIDSIALPAIERLQLSNGIPVWRINAGTQELIKLELLFDAGRWQEPQRAIAAATVKMLLEGSSRKSAQQIAEAFEFYGATINVDAAIDYSTITLYCLTRHLPSLLPLLHEIIYEPAFPQHELDTHIRNSKQRLMVSLEKVDFLAHKEFNERLYGTDHPNGYTTSLDDYDRVQVELMKQFHQAAYVNGRFRLIAAGRVSDESLKLIDEYFGKTALPPANGSQPIREPRPAPGKKFFVEKSDAVQSAIRIGKQLVNKTHPDFPKLRVLNTVLGGYFGSRLMQNLREDKGYCYGVHSGIASFLRAATFFVTTEVGRPVTQSALQEIYKEIRRLRTEPVPQEELKIVKSYMLGVMLGDVDGPLNLSEIIRGLIVFGLDESYFEGLVEQTKSAAPEELMHLAEKYLDPDSMIEVVAGAKSGD